MANWYVIRGGVELGPFQDKQLKELASSGKIKPQDSIRREDVAKACKAIDVKGLFRGVSPSVESHPNRAASVPPPIVKQKISRASRTSTPIEPKTDAPPKFSFKDTAMAAARLGAAQTERAKLSNMTLPQLYMALGKHCLSAPEFQKEFGDRIVKLHQLQDELTQLKNQTADATNTISGKAKAAASYAVRSAQSAKLSMHQASQLSELGKAIYEKHGESSGLDTLTSPIRIALARVAFLEEQVSTLGKIGKGSWVTPKRALVSTAIASLMMMLLATGYLSKKESSSTPTASASTKSSQTASQKSIGLPKDLLNQKQWPKHRLEKIPSGRASFSKSDSYVIVRVHESNADQILSVKTGKEILAQSPECNCFSSPSAFSPDEKLLACVDGELLRIWDLTTAPASLRQTLQLGVPTGVSSGKHRTDSWTEVSWESPDSIFLSCIGVEGISHQFVQRAKENSFAPATEPIYQKRHELNGSYRRSSTTTTISRNGKFAASFHNVAPENEERYTHTLLSILDLQTDRNMNTLKVNLTDISIDFSPKSHAMILRESTGNLTLINTMSWKEVAKITPTFIEGSGSVVRSTIESFSTNEKYFAMLVVRSTKTSQGYTIRQSIEVFETESGKRLQTLELNRTPSQKNPYNELVPENLPPRIMFTSDERSIIATETRPSFYENGQSNKYRNSSWTLFSWDVATGNINCKLENENLDGFPRAISNDGKLLIVSVKPKESNNYESIVLSVPHLTSLVSGLNAGNKLWDAGEKKKAFSQYCSILTDEMSWFVSKDIPILWSRCVDFYADKGEVSSARLVADHARTQRIALSPETDKGKQLLDKYANELAEAKQKKDEESGIARQQRFLKLRAKNKSDYVSSHELTKKQLRAKLNEKLSGGRIDSMYAFGHWDDYALQDSFGEPDSNVEFIDGKRLVVYTCKDGLTQLTVTFVGDSLVILHGINEY